MRAVRARLHVKADRFGRGLQLPLRVQVIWGGMIICARVRTCKGYHNALPFIEYNCCIRWIVTLALLDRRGFDVTDHS